MPDVGLEFDDGLTIMDGLLDALTPGLPAGLKPSIVVRFAFL